MMIYVACKICDCYVHQDEASQIIMDHPDDDYFICFDCQPKSR